MSAGTLLRWVRADAEGNIGSNGKKLAQLIDVAVQRALQKEIDSKSRAVFRETALEVMRIARTTRALPTSKIFVHNSRAWEESRQATEDFHAALEAELYKEG
jgi:hypothetical protein